ncbi:hypothetical protein BRW84_04555 [Oxalobacter formigenes OXCC13]|nr:hypothetical protein BRW83_0982 [Oxalobacter formigenes]ARQ77967.1 hypothetical protein BRW84_04555 [Oxalobacter formigenes OXCC13]
MGRWLGQIPIAIDPLVNVFFCSLANETISNMEWRKRNGGNSVRFCLCLTGQEEGISTNWLLFRPSCHKLHATK